MRTVRGSFLDTIWILILSASCATGTAEGQTNSISFTNRQGAIYSDITVVKVDANGLIYRYNNGGGGGKIKLSELPDGLVRQLGFDPTQVINQDREKANQEANQQLDRAIATGMFREVNGIIYDLRKIQSDWVTIQNVIFFQSLDGDEALIDPKPNDLYNKEVYHVRHLSTVPDTQLFSFRAKPVGTYNYINKAGNSRSVRSYDAGRICKREEIPDNLLAGRIAFARALQGTKSLGEIISLSDADSLVASGTGFLITEDGYLVTNNHVVNNAKKLRVRVGSKTLDAQIVKTSKSFDLAVLKIEGAFKPLLLDFDRRIKLGDSVFTIGYPNVDVQGAAPKYTDGKISSLSGMEDDPFHYQISVPLQPGNSGGPLVAENGAVVGIVNAKLNDLTALLNSGSIPQNVNYAIKVKYLRDLLETIPGVLNGVKSAPSDNKSVGSVAMTEEAAVMVLVY